MTTTLADDMLARARQLTQLGLPPNTARWDVLRRDVLDGWWRAGPSREHLLHDLLVYRHVAWLAHMDTLTQPAADLELLLAPWSTVQPRIAALCLTGRAALVPTNRVHARRAALLLGPLRDRGLACHIYPPSTLLHGGCPDPSHCDQHPGYDRLLERGRDAEVMVTIVGPTPAQITEVVRRAGLPGDVVEPMLGKGHARN